MHLEPSKKT